MRTISISRKLTVATAIVLSVTPFVYWAILVWRFYND